MTPTGIVYRYDVVTMKDATQQLRHAAERFLARREHSAYELKQKLTRYTDDMELIDKVIVVLQHENWQSDERFVESYSRSRVERGYGPLVVQAELIAKGIDESLVTEAIEQLNQQVEQSIKQVYAKKFADQPIADYHDKAKRMQFLQRRGFSHEQIRALLG